MKRHVGRATIKALNSPTLLEAATAVRKATFIDGYRREQKDKGLNGRFISDDNTRFKSQIEAGFNTGKNVLIKPFRNSKVLGWVNIEP